MKISLRRASAQEASMLVGFERKIAHPKLYGSPLDLEGAGNHREPLLFYNEWEYLIILETVRRVVRAPYA
jgi:hypothetical protein